ncbi:MAG: hypothetical protein WCU90_05475, partial [Kiritimatiellia bacterium]
MKRTAYRLWVLMIVVLGIRYANAQTLTLPVERRMLFNNWTGRELLDDKRQDYYLPYWTHEGPEPLGREGDARKALLNGTNHVYSVA